MALGVYDGTSRPESAVWGHCVALMSAEVALTPPLVDPELAADSPGVIGGETGSSGGGAGVIQWRRRDQLVAAVSE